jgi:hypothetical protein
MTVFELESTNKDFKSFVFFKTILSQFKYCTYIKKRTMTIKFDVDW